MNKRKLIALLLMPLGLFGCYPGGPNDLEDLGLVVTHRDTAFDFQQLNTFSLPDEVVNFTGNLVEGQLPEFVGDPYSQDILGAIRQNMTAYGWIEVDESSNPDVIILPSVVMASSYGWWTDAQYWNWYYPVDLASWSYTFILYGGSSSSGSVIIRMTYPEGATPTDAIPVLWAGFCNGLVEGSTSNISGRILAGVNKAFHQSPYLLQ